MAFFKSFQESLSSVSVSSFLDSVSSTVDGLATAVSDVTYTVSDQLTEQVTTIINKVQGEEETEAAAEVQEGDSVGRTNSKRQAYADEEEERREQEKQEQERRNEEQQWEWCHSPSKGWYRKRRDPNQKEATADPPNHEPHGTDDHARHRASTHRDSASPLQEDTISKASAETAYCEDMALETHQTSDQNNPSDQTSDQNNPSDQTSNRESNRMDNPSEYSTSSNPDYLKQISSNGVSAAQEHTENPIKTKEPEVRNLENEDQEAGSRSRCPSEVKDVEDGAREDHTEMAVGSDDKKEVEPDANKVRFRKCTLL